MLKCKCGYCECICHIPELNHKPDYKVGQVWRMYGGFSDDIKIVWMNEKYIVGEDLTNKSIYAHRIGRHGYAGCGTPTLRTKISD